MTRGYATVARGEWRVGFKPPKCARARSAGRERSEPSTAKTHKKHKKGACGAGRRRWATRMRKNAISYSACPSAQEKSCYAVFLPRRLRGALKPHRGNAKRRFVILGKRMRSKRFLRRGGKSPRDSVLAQNAKVRRRRPYASQMRWLFVGEALVLRKEQRILAFLVLKPPVVLRRSRFKSDFLKTSLLIPTKEVVLL
jgi:hypothetical protein